MAEQIPNYDIPERV